MAVAANHGASLTSSFSTTVVLFYEAPCNMACSSQEQRKDGEQRTGEVEEEEEEEELLLLEAREERMREIWA